MITNSPEALNDHSPNSANGKTDEPQEQLNKSINYFALYDAFKDLCINNAEYFRSDDSENGQRLHCAFFGLLDHLTTARRFVAEIKEFAHEYDFSENVPGNGYRSFLFVVRSCITHGLKLSSYIMQNRSSILFRKSLYMKEVEACSHLLASLCTFLQHLITLRQWSEPGSLFPAGSQSAEELFATADTINQYCFYGRCLGVQYCESIQSVLKFLAIVMAGFSEAYYKEGGTFTKTTSSMWTSGKYYWNPELRARRIVNISQNAEIDFCKSFWFLAENEIMQSLPSVLGTSVKINKIITIPPEPIQIKNEITGEMIDIPVPISHLGPGSVTARLISYHRREGMMGERKNKKHTHPAAKGLLFHCHGGGFVAQSSKSHEIYLRDWAVALDIPILSIDYSLAPDAPFPRACEEVFYAYCWSIKNCSLLGTTAEKIVFAGDSAGANLNLACAIKCIEMNIRKPDGLFLAYCPIRISFDLSPARLLCLMDPLLPFGFMMRCLKAYACPSKMVLLRNKENLAKKDAIKYAKAEHVNDNASASTSSTVNVLKMSDTDSDMPTFVNISEKPYDKTENSASINGSSAWEHIDNDANLEDHKSPGSDGTSDTFASASLHSQTVGNTEMMTPDESNGISFEEDSQPITIHKPIIGDIDITYTASDDALNQMEGEDEYRSLSAAAAIELDQSNDSKTYVDEFMERYILDTGEGDATPILRSVPASKSEENILLDEGRELINVQNIQNKFYKVVGDVTTSVSNRFNAMTTSTPIRECSEFAYVRSRLNSKIPKSLSEEFVFDIPKDPLLSPYWAADDILQQMPPTQILTVDLDPCLDDCVMFAKRLQKLNTKVGLDILHGLCHGFLNFVKISKEAQEGSNVCIKRIAALLETNDGLKE